MKYFSILLLLVFASSCVQSKSKHITEISQEELENVILVDVRTPEEYSEGHLDRAVNINWYEADFTDQFDKIDKNETIYVYCKAGGRSAMAQEKLNAIGFKKVVNLEGGYDAWKAKNQ